jgi:hypothetical protein
LLYFWDVACHMIESHTMSCVIFGTLLAPTSLWFSCWSPPMLYTLPSGASSSWAILVTLSSRVDVVRASGWLLFLSTYSALFWKHCFISTSVSVTLQVIHRFSIIFNDAVPFTHQNRITLRVSIFDNVSSRHAICQLVCMAVWHASCTFSRLSDDSYDLFLPAVWWNQRSYDGMKCAVTLFCKLAHVYPSTCPNIPKHSYNKTTRCTNISNLFLD